MNKEEWITLRDSYWPGVVKAISELIQFEIIKLKECKPHELIPIQEGIRQLERLKDLPNILIEADNFGELPASAQVSVTPAKKK